MSGVGATFWGVGGAGVVVRVGGRAGGWVGSFGASPRWAAGRAQEGWLVLAGRTLSRPSRCWTLCAVWAGKPTPRSRPATPSVHVPAFLLLSLQDAPLAGSPAANAAMPPPPFRRCLPACRVSKFNGVHSIDLYIPANFGADCTEVVFVGFKGEFSERRRQVRGAFCVCEDGRGSGWGLGVGRIAWGGSARVGRRLRMGSLMCVEMGLQSWHVGRGLALLNSAACKSCALHLLPLPWQAVEAVYEAKPMPQDHRVPGDEQGAGWNLGM